MVEAALTESNRFSWSWADIKSLLFATYKEWSEDDAPHIGAALAFYTILSLAPLLVVMIAIAGWVLGQKAVSGQLMTQIQGMVGSEGAKAIQEMLKAASNPKQGIAASALGLLTLLFGAASVLGELRLALNRIWKVPKPEEEGVAGIIKNQSRLLGLVLGCGFLLLVSLVLSATLAAAGKFMQSALPAPAFMFEAVNFVVSLAVLAGVFAAIFKYIPSVNVPWGDVLLGAGVTSILFTLGKFLIGLYLGKASIGSTFGAAGSLVIVLVWVYYSSQILFFGAEFTHVYSKMHGSNPLKRWEERTPTAAVQTTRVPWMAYGTAAASGSAMLPPVLPIAPIKKEPPGFAAALGGLTGAVVALVKSVKNGVRG
jgi:membrane protein